jgi:hypothetical protein
MVFKDNNKFKKLMIERYSSLFSKYEFFVFQIQIQIIKDMYKG